MGSPLSLHLSAPLRARARYVRCFFKKGPRAKRMLIGELVLVPAAGEMKRRAGLLAPTPLQIKRALDKALLDAKVPFLYGCYATDVLRDASGKPAGIVMANRAGRQVVKERVIIDATDRAWVARMAASGPK